MAVLGLATAAALAGSPAAAAGTPAPPPENLRVVLADDGTVARLDWDRPADGSDPNRYFVNYTFASDGAFGEQVFWSTTETHLDSAGTFGHFVECSPSPRPSDQWIVWITYRTPDGVSLRSNEATMCLP